MLASIQQRLVSLGWQHRGFRVGSERAAWVGLLLLLAPLFVINQIQAQHRRDAGPLRIETWTTLSQSFLANPSPELYRDNPWYLYPPLYLTLVWPLAQLPAGVMLFCFQTLKWAALVGCLRLTWRLASPIAEDLPPIVTLGSLVLAGRFLWNELIHYNINMFLLLAVLAAAYWVRRNREVLGGALVALAACIKVTPALVGVYFLYKGRWKTAIGASIMLVVGLLLFPALWIGWQTNLDTLAAWYHHVITRFVQEGGVNSIHTNQSLGAWMNRLFGDALAIQPDTHITIVSLSPAVRNAIRNGIAVVVLLVLGWICRSRRCARQHNLAYTAELSLVLIVMLLLSGYTWKSHYVAILPAYTVLLAFLADARYSGPRRIVGALTLLSFVLCTLNTFQFGDGPKAYSEAYGVVMFGGIIAAIAVAIVHRSLCRTQQQ